MFGSAMSLRSYSKFGSVCSVFSLSRFGSSMSVLDFVHLGSAISLTAELRSDSLRYARYSRQHSQQKLWVGPKELECFELKCIEER